MLGRARSTQEAGSEREECLERRKNDFAVKSTRKSKVEETLASLTWGLTKEGFGGIGSERTDGRICKNAETAA